MKQTAVEWLEIQLFKKQGKFNKSDIEQAKAMEKEQIMEAREDGHLSTYAESIYAEYGSTPKCYLDGGHEQYYNETFKSE